VIDTVPGEPVLVIPGSMGTTVDKLWVIDSCGCPVGYLPPQIASVLTALIKRNQVQLSGRFLHECEPGYDRKSLARRPLLGVSVQGNANLLPPGEFYRNVPSDFFAEVQPFKQRGGWKFPGTKSCLESACPGGYSVSCQLLGPGSKQEPKVKSARPTWWESFIWDCNNG
jgi:hypothetical protein